MKITILEKQAGEEDEIIVKCDYLDDNMTKLINQFKTGKGKMSFYKASVSRLNGLTRGSSREVISVITEAALPNGR